MNYLSKYGKLCGPVWPSGKEADTSFGSNRLWPLNLFKGCGLWALSGRLCESVWFSGKLRQTEVRTGFGRLFSSKVVVYGHGLVDFVS